MTWRVARSLDVLCGEVDRSAPNRSKASDGSIGDAAHASRTSDHNPWVKDANGVGVVRARDFTHDPKGGLDCNRLAERLVALLGKHPALGSGAYVIWNRRIISTDRLREGWRSYSGSNPHDKHLHVSVGTAAGAYDSMHPWFVQTAPKPAKRRKKMVDRAWVRFATLNVLAAHRTRVGAKLAHLFRTGEVRIRWALALWHLWRVTVVGLQEVQPSVARIIRRRKHWTIYCGRRNDKLGGCSAVAFRDDVWEVLDLDDVPVKISDGRTLHQPFVRLKHRRTGEIVEVGTGHPPARGPVSGGSNRDRADVKLAILNRANEADVPVALLLDSNDTHAEQDFPGYTVAAKSGVDLILTDGLRTRRPKVHRAVKGRISDHPMLSIQVKV